MELEVLNLRRLPLGTDYTEVAQAIYDLYTDGRLWLQEMHNHAPVGYDCPFCRLVLGLDTPASSQDDIVYRDDDVLAFVPSSRWPNNPAHVIVIPTAHHENIYDLPAELATPIQRVARAVAIAFKATYACHGVSTR